MDSYSNIQAAHRDRERGRYKLPALRAALRGRLFNGLITDEMAAKELLNSD